MSRSQPDDDAVHRPLYARMLGLRHLSPGGLLCFVFLEGAIALGILLALAELVSWWGVIILPVTVALMVKLNDVIAGSVTRPSTSDRPVTARAPVPRPPAGTPGGTPAPVGEETTRLPGMVIQAGVIVKRPWAERLDARHQWARQSATRRYE
jgi:hypothetical protein